MKHLATAAAFTITTPSTTAKLDANRKAQVAFTATNASIQPLRGRARVVPMDVAKPEWFVIAGDAERAFAASGTQQYTVQIAVPPTAPAGTYKFELKVVGVTNPDEQYGESQQVAFEVPQPVKASTPIPWIWIVAAVLAVLILGGTALGFYLANRKPTASFNAASMDFGDQLVGTPSGSKNQVTLKSTGPVDLHVKSVSISGANAGDFQTTDACSGKTVGSGTSCVVSVVFKPAATGARTGNLLFALDTQSGSQSISLKGQGVQPQISLSENPLKLHLGGPFVYSYSGTLIITNTGTADLHIATIQANPPGGYGMNEACSGKTIAPQRFCLITVFTNPGWPPVGDLVIVDDADSGPRTVHMQQ